MNTLKKKLLVAGQMADHEMDLLLAELPGFSPEHLTRHLRRYILLKFLLPSGCEESDLFRLAELSIDAVLRETNGALPAQDLSIGCGSASSVMTKKLLLLLSIQEKLNLKFDPMRTPQITSVEQLSAEIREILQGKERGTIVG